MTVTSVSVTGKAIGISPPLRYMHYGQITQVNMKDRKGITMN